MSIAEHGAITHPRPNRGVRSPIELIVTGATRLARLQTTPDFPRSTLQQWCNGVAKVCSDRAPFAAYWHQRNDREMAGTGPLWVVLGDSASQGLGAEHPEDGYVSQARAQLVRETGAPWRVLNLSRSGATIPDVLREQLPRLAALRERPALISCGAGTNDLLRVSPQRVRVLIRNLIDAVPDDTVLLDMPVPHGKCRVGRFAARYVININTHLHAAARERRLPVAYVSRHFTPPWLDKFGPDDFHPNAAGYQDWSRAVLQALPVLR
jgi:acyl-CoA thioesterase I